MMMPKQIVPLATPFAGLLLLTSTASADITDWLAEVASGTSARYVDGSPGINTNVDIGVYAGTEGATYEILFNAGNYNGGAGPATTPSSALIGARNTFVGAQGGCKFEQWNDTGQYGVTEFGVADFTIGPNMENTDLQVVFVCDTINNNTDVYENGVLVGSAPYAFKLEGMHGIGQVHDPTGGDADMLDGEMFGVAVYDSMLSVTEIIAHRDAFFSGGIGTNYCMAALNSTGMSSHILASGSRSVAANTFTLIAEDLPQNSFGFFITGQTQAFTMNPGGSAGNLCMGGTIGRFQLQIQNSGAGGTFQINADLSAFPTPSGTPRAVLPGETWNFQAWHRDSDPMGNATSNFTEGLEVVFI